MLTFQFVPFAEMANLNSEQRISKLIEIVKKNKIILMQGRLRPSEEAGLIQKTMELISKDFKGIELCTVYPEAKNEKFFSQVKHLLLRVLIGQTEGLTIIGPATIIKEIKRNPDKIELLTHNMKRRS
ncbi:DUF2073 domain-containing protein [Candidatus Woesearchaeota archaeon]|nr:MAG: DUF2073 domain-containing protein [Candidatus Woesearchaeota archaeon]